MTKQTPADKWKESLSNYRKTCQEILKISSGIRYAGVINVYGRTLTGIVRSDVKPMLKSEDVKNEFFIISTLMTLRKSTASSIGALNYILLQHQKVSIILFQKNNVTYYVSIERKEKGIDKIISSIKKTI